MNWKQAAIIHAKEEAPKESCGLLVEVKGKEHEERTEDCDNCNGTGIN